MSHRFIVVSLVCFSLVLSCKPRAPKAKDNFLEYCSIAYSDVISFVVQGYQCHWEDMNPSEMGLSSVYRYESDCCGSCQKDINGDGIPELLLGDQFDDGSFLLYDILTFDFKSGDVIHILSGGERDSFTVNTDGVIFESGSNSASDSFTKYYKLSGTKLSETSELIVNEELMAIHIDPFIRYVAPTAYVVLKDGMVLGQLIKTVDNSYLVEAQDTMTIRREEVSVELWSAWDGKGVVWLKSPGKAPAYSEPDSSASVLGEIVHESGMCPVTYRCLGYRPGWFRINLGKTEGFIREEVSEWDFADRH